MRDALDISLASSRLSITVRFCETDLMGVVHHANYLIYCEAARVDWLRKRGVSYQAWVRHGVHLPVVEAKARYKKAAHFDQELDVDTTATELSRITVRFRYRITHERALVCEAETLLACVGNDLRLKRMPDEVRAALLSGEVV